MSGRLWAYIGAILGGAVSIAANVAHSYVPPTTAPAGWRPHDGAILGAVFWPVALFVAIETLAKVGWPAGWRFVAVRYLGLLPVAVVAAVVSYRHLSGLLAFYGEDSLTVVIGPLAVDGLMVMATGALIATSRPAPLADAPTEPAPALELPADAPTDVDPADVDDLDEAAEGDASNVATPARHRKAPALARIAKVRARYPRAGQEAVARRADVALRTVQRNWDVTTPAEPDTARANGTPVPDLITTS